MAPFLPRRHCNALALAVGVSVSGAQVAAASSAHNDVCLSYLSNIHEG